VALEDLEFTPFLHQLTEKLFQVIPNYTKKRCEKYSENKS
jgi:hypothetical protein